MTSAWSESAGPGDTSKPLSVSIAILTYKRTEDLQRCVTAVHGALQAGPTVGFRFDEILVVDNDAAGSAAAVIERASGTEHSPGGEHAPDNSPVPSDSPVVVRYVCETSPGVANARNRALTECQSEILVFIDDDEVPGTEWPNGLLSAMKDSGAALVGGPVDTLFAAKPPQWIIEGAFFDRANPPHLEDQTWLRSGNLALHIPSIRACGLRFDPRLRVSEDVAFTRAAAAAGLHLVWSRHGSVSEYVDADRYSVVWRCRREFLAQRGWADTTMRLRDQDRPALRTALRGVHLLATGLATVMAAALPPSKARAVHGLATVCGGLGRLRGLLSR